MPLPLITANMYFDTVLKAIEASFVAQKYGPKLREAEGT